MALMPFSRDLFSMPDPFGSDPFGALMRPLTDTTLGAMAMAPRGMPLDVVEKDDSFEIRADVPGVNKDNISVTVDQGNVLNIKVDQKAEKREEGAKWHRYERTQSFVQRALRMPETADLDNIKARYENGVLQLDMPKKPTGKEQKRIDVA